VRGFACRIAEGGRPRSAAVARVNRHASIDPISFPTGGKGFRGELAVRPEVPSSSAIHQGVLIIWPPPVTHRAGQLQVHRFVGKLKGEISHQYPIIFRQGKKCLLEFLVSLPQNSYAAGSTHARRMVSIT
jgi:hypothetical protein